MLWMPTSKVDARAKRRLFKNERDELAAESGSVAAGTRLDVGRELKEFRACARGSIPLR